ncbi:hypothetical protein [Thiobacillus sp.]
MIDGTVTEHLYALSLQKKRGGLKPSAARLWKRINPRCSIRSTRPYLKSSWSVTVAPAWKKRDPVRMAMNPLSENSKPVYWGALFWSPSNIQPEFCHSAVSETLRGHAT